MSSELSLGVGGSSAGICEVTESTLRVVVNDVSKLKKRICSPNSAVVLRGIPFQILVEPVVDKVKRHTSLGVFLECNYAQKDPTWSCKVLMKITLLIQKKDCKNIDFEYELQHTFPDNSGTRWGFPNFILWSKLVDPLNGYVVNDKIVLRIKVNANSPVGIQHRHLHDMQIFGLPKPSTTTQPMIKEIKSKAEDQVEDKGQEENVQADLETSMEEKGSTTAGKKPKPRVKLVKKVNPESPATKKIAVALTSCGGVIFSGSLSRVDAGFHWPIQVPEDNMAFPVENDTRSSDDGFEYLSKKIKFN